MTIEWDPASYRRKFVGTWAYCQGKTLPPAWRYISDITDSGAVYTDGCIGYVCGEEQRLLGEECPFPEVFFIYKSVPPGLYWDKRGNRPFLLSRIHIKQYEVGIGQSGYNAYYMDRDAGTLRPMMRWTTYIDPDFDKPAPHIKTDDLEIFNSQLFRLNKNLFCFREVVGFMEDGVCFLRNLKFTSIVKPYLGEKWQIVDL